MSAAFKGSRINIGLILFIVLAIGVVVRYSSQLLDSGSKLNDEAVELMNLEKFDSALEKLDQAVAENPDNVPANYHRGICLAEKHRWDEAIAAFDRVTALDPREPKAPFNKGKVLWHLERYTEAIPAFEQAVGLKHDYPEAWILMAESLYELYLNQVANQPDEPGDPQRAIQAFQTYLSLRPGASDRQAVQQKIDILRDPKAHPEVLERRKSEKSNP